MPDPRETLPPAIPSLFDQNFPTLQLPNLSALPHSGELTVIANGDFVIDYSIDLAFFRLTRQIQGTLLLGDLDTVSMTRDVMFVSNAGVFMGTIDEWIREIEVTLPFQGGLTPAVFR